jgi:hypothetical protein
VTARSWPPAATWVSCELGIAAPRERSARGCAPPVRLRARLLCPGRWWQPGLLWAFDATALEMWKPLALACFSRRHRRAEQLPFHARGPRRRAHLRPQDSAVDNSSWREALRVPLVPHVRIFYPTAAATPRGRSALWGDRGASLKACRMACRPGKRQRVLERTGPCAAYCGCACQRPPPQI